MSNLRVESHSQGSVLQVRVLAGARRPALRGIHDGALKVAIAQPAEKGRANRSLVEYLTGVLGLQKSQIEILSGEHSSQKRLLIRDLAVEELKKRIEATLQGAND